MEFENLLHVLWGLNWILKLSFSVPHRQFIGHTWKQAPDCENSVTEFN